MANNNGLILKIVGLTTSAMIALFAAFWLTVAKPAICQIETNRQELVQTKVRLAEDAIYNKTMAEDIIEIKGDVQEIKKLLEKR